MDRSRPKGAWQDYPDHDPDAQVTWAQVNAKVDEILERDRPRRRTFSGAPVGENRVKETVTILPHGARQIKVHFPDE